MIEGRFQYNLESAFFLCLYSMNFSRKPEYWELEQEFEEWE